MDIVLRIYTCPDIEGLIVSYFVIDDIKFINGKIENNTLCDYASKNGQIKLLIWLRSQKSPYSWNRFACSQWPLKMVN